MRRSIILCINVLFFVAGLALPCLAQEKAYTVEILQITALEELQWVYEGFLKELEKDGIVPGKNLTVKRTIIDFDIENKTMTKQIKAYLRIKSEAARIAKEKPDLVLTMGTPATKYAKDKVIAAGIPLVFTALAFPQAVGGKSFTEAGPGFTGSITYMDMKDALKVVRKVFPDIRVAGIVHSGDANSIAHVEEAKKQGPAYGFTFVSKQVDMKERITPALQTLQKQGAQAFAVPPDPYYELHDHEKASELNDFSKATRIPAFSFVIDKIPGAILYVGTDFGVIGSLAGRQAVKILKDGAKPETLPILRQQPLSVMVDTKLVQAFGIKLPPEVLSIARPVD
ncbi:MAG TPA: ABC transporter substrate binding protein [Deltaproteobacteria bacterium]|nr:ABC transporter substrate binding protein [Deltaproteobacteria bacterium]